MNCNFLDKNNYKLRRRIRILFIIDGFRLGGAEIKLFELIQNLDNKLFDIELINVGSQGALSDRFYSLNIPVFNLSRKHRFDFFPFLKLVKKLKRQKIDIVQTTLFWADFIGSIAGFFAKIPIIISWETVTHSGKYYHNKLQRMYGYRFAMHFCNIIVAVSKQVKKSLKQYPGLNPDKIRVIYYGVDLKKHRYVGKQFKIEKRQKLNLPINSFVIGIIARLEPQKGHRIFIEAISELVKENSNIYVLSVGEGSQKDNIVEQIKINNLTNNFRILGARDDIPAILNSIDLFCLPSIAGEGLPNAILEAMACGKPVVATDVGGSNEIIRDGFNGFLVPSKNTMLLRSRLIKLISDPDLLKFQGRNAYQFVTEEYSLENEIKSFQELYISSYKNLCLDIKVNNNFE